MSFIIYSKFQVCAQYPIIGRDIFGLWQNEKKGASFFFSTFEYQLFYQFLFFCFFKFKRNTNKLSKKN